MSEANNTIALQGRLRDAAVEFHSGSAMEVLLLFAADRIDYLESQIRNLEQVIDAVDRRHREVRDAIAIDRDELKKQIEQM